MSFTVPVQISGPYYVSGLRRPGQKPSKLRGWKEAPQLGKLGPVSLPGTRAAKYDITESSGDLRSLLGLDTAPGDSSAPQSVSGSGASDVVREDVRPVPPAAEGPLAPAAGSDGVGNTAADAATSAQSTAADAAQDLLLQAPPAAGSGAGEPEGLDALRSAADGAAESLSGAVSSASAQALCLLEQGKQALSKAAEGLEGDAGEMQRLAGGSLKQMQTEAGEAVAAAESSLSSSAAAAAAAASEAAGRAFGSLPEPLQDALRAAAPAASKAAGALRDQPPGLVAAATAAAVGLPTLLLYRAKYGGFAGFLSAGKALEMMQEEEAILVDIRPAAEREASGIPELRRAARKKAVAVPMAEIDARLRGRVDNAAALAEAITAARIAGLASLSPATTKVIVMDGSGTSAKRMARMLRGLGISRPFVLDGGFRSFAKEGLGVAQGVSAYDATQLQVVADDVIAASETLAEKLKDPVNLAGLAAGSATVGVALWQYHLTLQYIGVASLTLTVVRKLASYSSPVEFFEEVGTLIERAQTAVTPSQSRAFSRVNSSTNDEDQA